MEITFAGAAREVTGSCHIVRVNDQTIMLDCGLFQGRRKDVEEKNRRLPVALETLDAIVLSHAHIDHAGRLPFLVKQGFRGRIHATTATRDLCEVMLADSAHIQEKDAEFLQRRGKEAVEPLYTMRDTATTIERMAAQRYRQKFEVVSGVTATFHDAGHILGSASVTLEWKEGTVVRRLGFSGDVGRSGLAIIRDPEPPSQLDWMIMESTYGDRDHESVDGARAELARVVRETAARGGRILVPAFAVGRTQELLYDLHVLAHAGEIPRLPIYVDSPLAGRATEVFRSNTTEFDESEELVQRHAGRRHEMLDFDLVRFTPSVEESKAIMQAKGPVVVIAASGMAESGRILHHLAHGASDPRNTVLIVGFQAEHTLGRRIVERRDELRIHGDMVPLRAQVAVLNGYSAHADRTELQAWLDETRDSSPSLRDVFLVHGEVKAQDALTSQLAARGYQVRCPEPMARVTR